MHRHGDGNGNGPHGRNGQDPHDKNGNGVRDVWPYDDSSDLPQGVVGLADSAHPTSGVIRFALCCESRGGCLHVFMPPVDHLEQYLDLVAAIEDTSDSLDLPIVVEGYLPPHDARLRPRPPERRMRDRGRR